MKLEDRQFVCHYHQVGWEQISLGITIDFRSPNIELHLPFGFLKIGWMGIYTYEKGEVDKINFTIGKQRT